MPTVNQKNQEQEQVKPKRNPGSRTTIRRFIGTVQGQREAADGVLSALERRRKNA